MTRGPGRMRPEGGRPRSAPLGAAFWRFWSVELSTETGLGLAVIALQTMVVLDLGGGATEVGWLSSARWLPYMLLGLTLLVPLVLLELEAGPAGLGVALGVLGGATLVGTALAGVVATRLGTARTIVGARAMMPIAWSAAALSGSAGDVLPGGLAIVVLLAGLALAGLAMGVENPSEMALRQLATPDGMQARMNATMRTVNRAMIVVAAPLGGILGDAIGVGAALVIVCAGFAVAALGLALSPLARGRGAA